jgi:hypothetical protein
MCELSQRMTKLPQPRLNTGSPWYSYGTSAYVRTFTDVRVGDTYVRFDLGDTYVRTSTVQYVQRTPYRTVLGNLINF